MELVTGNGNTITTPFPSLEGAKFKLKQLFADEKVQWKEAVENNERT